MTAERNIDALAAQVPQWLGKHIAIRPLDGGITNRNFVATVDGSEYVLRVPGERTELLGIDRANEAEASRRAASLGIAPPIVGELPETGTMITQLVAGCHREGDEFVRRLPDVVAMLRTFHDSAPLRGSFPIHRVVEWHARDAASFGVEPPAMYHDLHRQSLRIEMAFNRAPVPLVPCHNDLLPGNVLFDNHRAWLLDFEYAGMNDRFFDLGNLSINCGLSTSADVALVEMYLGTCSPMALARLNLMKVMSEFREGMWAVVQQAISTLDTDFVTYADQRLQSCHRLTAVPEFEGWLDAAAHPMDG